MITKSQITTIKSLREKNCRVQLSLFVAEGEKMFEEIFKSDFFIKKLFFIKDSCSDDTLEKISHLFKKNYCEICEVSTKEMERITNLKTATPILICIEIPKYEFQSDKNKLILALDGVQDPGNMGTIIRIADWFGINDVLCSFSTADIYNPKVVQATMGAITRVRVHYVSIEQTLAVMNTPIYGTFLNGDNINSLDLSMKNGVIVMGNEGNGISDEVAKLVTQKVFIPPYPIGEATSESLNVGVATAIICNEFRKIK